LTVYNETAIETALFDLKLIGILNSPFSCALEEALTANDIPERSNASGCRQQFPFSCWMEEGSDIGRVKSARWNGR
jgi:hypothetical protein